MGPNEPIVTPTAGVGNPGNNVDQDESTESRRRATFREGRIRRGSLEIDKSLGSAAAAAGAAVA